MLLLCRQSTFSENQTLQVTWVIAKAKISRIFRKLIKLIKSESYSFLSHKGKDKIHKWKVGKKGEIP